MRRYLPLNFNVSLFYVIACWLSATLPLQPFLIPVVSAAFVTKRHIQKTFERFFNDDPFYSDGGAATPISNGMKHHKLKQSQISSQLLPFLSALTTAQRHRARLEKSMLYARTSRISDSRSDWDGGAYSYDDEIDDDDGFYHYCPLEDMLRSHRFGGARMKTVKRKDLPLLAEVFIDGQIVLANLVSFQPSFSSPLDESDSAIARVYEEPKLVVELFTEEDEKLRIVDFGQLTTIWLNDEEEEENEEDRDVALSLKSKIPDHLSVVVEQALDRLYTSRVGRARSFDSGALTKKQINQLVSNIDLGYPENPIIREHCGAVMRKVAKAGVNYSRLIDSEIAAQSAMFQNKVLNRNVERRENKARNEIAPISFWKQRALVSKLLANDAKTGGRFKRWPSICLSVLVDMKSYQTENQADEKLSSPNRSAAIESVKLVNGGWIIVDQSIRASTEARKFAERVLATEDQTRSPGNMTAENPQAAVVPAPTAADERITRRLECLAMGEVFSSQQQNSYETDSRLELDVRETLKVMDLPLTPKGARVALVSMGRWTGKENFSVIEPWSKEIIEAAACFESNAQTENFEGRVDLSKLPCICVDAKRTSFRDDALGIRPRSMTGRPLVPGASQWEILVHIADVSDIYFSDDSTTKKESLYLTTLKAAAKKRGTSRYDLPLGPLHLLPPKVLLSISFSKEKQRQRAVTLWVYIDERDGSLLDAGLEQSIIGPVRELSFADAVALMNSPADSEMPKSSLQARTMLLLLERNLGFWFEKSLENSDAARKRQARLESKQRKAEAFYWDEMADDGSDGFIRTRGHRLVDLSLDLYGRTLSSLVRKAGASVPRVPGADASRNGRVATSPLRRYVDGEAQRQALAVLCNAGTPMTPSECREIGQLANDARNKINNVRAARTIR